MLIICSECGKEYSDQAKTCPHCGAKTSQNRYISGNIKGKNNNYSYSNNNMRGTTGNVFGSIVAIILILVIGFVGYKLFIGALGELGIEKGDIVSSIKDAWEHDSKNDTSQYTSIYNKGDKITTDKFEITITDIEERTKVGTLMFNESTSEGNVFICVRMKIKNISDKPIGTFSQPTFSLIDSKNVTYRSDISASSYYSTEVNTTDKALSDLNPGVTVTDACVFELGKSYYSQNTFNLKIDADKTILVRIK